jgi:uncharacterized LabA/DUF88 family protein
MGKLNIFIDGTWLLVQCAAGGSMANATDQPDHRFPLDFEKLNLALLEHVRTSDQSCDEIGDRYVSTSIFTLPSDFDNWPTQYDDLTAASIEKVRRAVAAREAFVADAADAGYRMDAVYRPPIRDYIVRRLAERRYQEKQVDTSVVALVVRSAITKPGDYHVIITGDSDILPAIRVAYPEFTTNVLVATTHPDELNPRHRQTAFALVDFAFQMPPFYMQNRENAMKLIRGSHVYRCEECGSVFATHNPIPRLSRARCVQHRASPSA